MKIAPILVASIALAIASPAFAWELNQGAAGPALTCNFSTAEVPSQCPNKCFPEPSQKIIFAMPLAPIQETAGDFFGQVFGGALGSAQRLGVPVSIRGNDVNDLNCDNIESYGQLIRAAAAEKPAGLVIIPAIVPDCNSTDVADALREAAASGVPLIAINSNPDVGRELGASLYVGQDEVLAGEEACAALVAAAGGNATILFMDVVNGADPGINARLEGCKRNATAVIETNVNTEIVANDTALIVAQLEANPRITAILANGGRTQVEAMIAATKKVGKEIGKDIWLATTDWSSNGTAQALNDGLLEFVVDQQAPLQGSAPVQLLQQKEVAGHLPSGTVLTGPVIVRQNGTFATQGLSACSSYARPICGSCEGSSNASSIVIENGVWSIDQAVGGNALCSFNVSDVPPECPACIAPAVSKIILALPFIEFNQSANVFWAQVVGGAANVADKIGAELSVRGVEGTAQDCEAISQYPDLLRAAASEKPDGIIVVPLQAPNCDVDVLGTIQEIAASGVPVVAINSNAQAALDAGALMYVGQDEIKAGEEACSALAAAAGGNTTVLFLDSEGGTNPGLNARRAGCENVATVVTINASGADMETDVAAVAAELESNEEITSILAMGAPNQVNLMLEAAAAANRTINTDLWLGTTDWSPLNVTEALSQGLLQFVVDQGAPSQGAIPVLMLAQRFKTGLFPSQPLLYTGPTLVTPNATFSDVPGTPSACTSFGLPYCDVCNGGGDNGGGDNGGGTTSGAAAGNVLLGAFLAAGAAAIF